MPGRRAHLGSDTAGNMSGNRCQLPTRSGQHGGRRVNRQGLAPVTAGRIERDWFGIKLENRVSWSQRRLIWMDCAPNIA